MGIFGTALRLQRLRRAAACPRERLDALRERRLRAVLAHAFERSAFYRQAFTEAGLGRGDVAHAPLAAFPAVDKATFLERFDDVVTVPGVTREALAAFDAGERDLAAAFGGRYHAVHSSGSTGAPAYFLYDAAAWRTMLSGITRGALWGMPAAEAARLLARRPRVLYAAATDGRYGGVTAVGGGLARLGMPQRSLDVNMPLARWAAEVRAFRPSIVIGYPSAVKLLASLAESGEAALSLERVITCGEPLPRGLRRLFEQAFRCPVINFYGASESLAMGVEADPDEGMVLFDDLNWVEAAEDGLYLTSLYNFAQPLIRYRLSDRLVLRPPAPGAACPFARAEGIQGRCEDLLWFEGAGGRREFLHPLAVEGFNVEGLRDYQFRKTAPAGFSMLAEVPDAAARPRVRAEMLSLMRPILEAKGLSHVAFDVSFADVIAPDPATGKKRLIVADEA